MKKAFKLFSLSAVALALLAGCQNIDKEPMPEMIDQDAISFSSNITQSGLRVAGNNWEIGDAIGVYMLPHGKPLAQAQKPINAKYSTTSDGSNLANFTPVDAANTLKFPSNGTVDFVAYYPHCTPTEGKIEVSTKDQSKQLNFLYSNNLKDKDKKAKPQPDGLKLSFKHVMSLLSFQLKNANGENIAFSDLTDFQVEGLAVEGTFDLASGIVTAKPSSQAIAMKSLQAIIVPQAAVKPCISIRYKDKSYKWTMDERALEAGKRYTLTLKLLDSAVVPIDNGSGEISDWEDEAIDAGELSPSLGIETQVPVSTIDNSTSLAVAADQTTATLGLAVADDARVKAESSDTSWLTVQSIANKIVALSIQPNAGADKRSATISLSATALRSGIEPFVVTVTQAGKGDEPTITEDLIISCYVEGSKSNKYIQLYNPTDQAITLDNVYELRQYNNGKTTASAEFTQSLTGTIQPKGWVVLAHKLATIYTGEVVKCSNKMMVFNGDDAITLAKNGKDMDAFFIPIGNKENLAADKTYRRKESITAPNLNFSKEEWEEYPQDNIEYLGKR